MEMLENICYGYESPVFLEEKLEPCGVCLLDDYTDPCQLPCHPKHIFCFNCVESILMDYSGECPFCRKKIPTDYLDRVMD